MLMKNRAKEVMAQIEDMTGKKAADLEQIQAKKQEAQTQKEAAEKAIRETTARMDLDAYEDAVQAKRKAQTALNMYSGRFTQLIQQEYITESESDKVIDSLLSYEDELAEDFREAIAEPLARLGEIVNGYIKAIEEAEETISTWETKIHANYRSQFTTYADGTNRSPQPIPVHQLPFTGCSEAEKVREFMDAMKN